MLETIRGNLYDYPKYYDLVYGSDWRAEFEFLLDCFEKHAEGEVQSVFEPACGTGRLLAKLATEGLAVAGNDLNPHAVDYCNNRLDRTNFPRTAQVGDMADFKLAKPVDAAFNMINSFRHLATEQQAASHLKCIADALRPGGIYVLGLHLTPTSCKPMQHESWPARRGNLAVLSRLWVVDLDRRRRRERVGLSFDVYTPTRQMRIEDEITFRTYTADQMQELLLSCKSLDLTACYDFSYDATKPIAINSRTEDIVFVLRKRA